ncbi:MAG: hypothetical protein V4590_13815, partial [Bacteroidota bacterium]
MNTSLLTMVRSLLLATLLTCIIPVLAQNTPDRMSYQAVVRNGSNFLVTNAPVGMRISIIKDSTGAKESYMETHTATTNANGLVTLEIGGGTVVSGIFANIDWENGPYNLKVETDPTGGTNYGLTVISRVLGVPYSIYARFSNCCNNQWHINGNTGTNPAVHFLGTTDNAQLNFRVNNQRAGQIDHLLFNTFMGYQAGIGNPTGKWNSGFGNMALRDNTTGHDNTALGDEVLVFNRTGNQNTGVGEGSLFFNQNGSNNTAGGYQAMTKNLSGNSNVAYGVGSLFENTSIHNLVAVGDSSLYHTGSGFNATTPKTAGIHNTALGSKSLYFNIGGAANTGTGFNALLNNTTGNENTAVGTKALFANVGGSRNTAIGNDADVSSAALTNASAIGSNAIVDSSNSMVLGSISGKNGATASTKVGIGVSAPTHRLHVDGKVRIVDGTEGNGKVLTSDPNGIASWQTPAAGGSGTVTSVATNNGITGGTITTTGTIGLTGQALALHNLATNGFFVRTGSGTVAARTITATTPMAIINGDGVSGDPVISLGQSGATTGQVLAWNGTTWAPSTATGNFWSLTGNTVTAAHFLGTLNSMPLLFKVNSNAAGKIDHINNNTTIGYLSATAITTGVGNTTFGSRAFNNDTSGHFNTAIGDLALASNTNANGNTGIGQAAAYQTTEGLFNTAVGQNSLFNNTTGDFNTALGSAADVSSGNFENATAVGCRSYVTQSNSMVLGSISGINGSLNNTSVGIGITAPSHTFHVKGTVRIDDGTQLTGRVLTTDANGVASWQNLPAGGSGTMTSLLTNNGITGGTITTSGTIGLTGQALALHNLGTNGFFVRTGAGTVAARTITGTTPIVVTNGDGVSADPVISLGQNGATTGQVLAWNGTTWAPSTATGNFWSLTGNTVTAAHFLGTLNSMPLLFKVNSNAAGKIDHINNNTTIGYLSATAITSGVGNTTFGSRAFNNDTSGHFNTAIGDLALASNTNANGNTAVGQAAAYQTATGLYNTALGQNSLVNNITGDFNTALGSAADVSSGGFVNATAVGCRSYVTQSNSMVLGSISGVNGSLNNTSVGIGVTAPSHTFHVKGTVRIDDGTQLAGRVLTTDATGVASWQNLPAGGSGTMTSLLTNNGITGGTITTSGTIGLTGQALALHNLGTNGFFVRTGAGTVAARTITGTTPIVVTNGDGVSADPVISLGQNGATTGQVLSWTGTAWAPANGAAGTFWSLSGNSITANDFLGSTNSMALNIKVNNQHAGKIDHVLENSFWGYLSGNTTITGNSNTGIGNFALSATSSGSSNTAVGRSALRLNTIGVGNTALGYTALWKNIDGTA